jgi:Uma2 family endonuclease
MSTFGRVTVEQFLTKAARGDFDPLEDHHVELIRGKIVPRYGDDPRANRSPPQQMVVDEILEWSFHVYDRDLALIRVQGAISIPALDSVPVQDLAWAVPKRYDKVHPSPEDVFLLIEVVDSSLRKDRGPKLELYAEAGIRDYWIVDIHGRCVIAHRDPHGLIFRDIRTYTQGQEVHSLAFPDVALAVSRLNPE